MRARVLMAAFPLLFLGCGSPLEPNLQPALAADESDGTASAEARKKKPKPSPTPRPPVLSLYEASRSCPPGVPVPEEGYLRPGCTVIVVCETTWDTSNHEMQLNITKSRGFIELWRLFSYEMRKVGELTAGSPSTPHDLQVACSLGPFLVSREWTVY